MLLQSLLRLNLSDILGLSLIGVLSLLAPSFVLGWSAYIIFALFQACLLESSFSQMEYLFFQGFYSQLSLELFLEILSRSIIFTIFSWHLLGWNVEVLDLLWLFWANFFLIQNLFCFLCGLWIPIFYKKLWICLSLAPWFIIFENTHKTDPILGKYLFFLSLFVGALLYRSWSLVLLRWSFLPCEWSFDDETVNL